MPDGRAPISVKVVDGIRAIPASAWDVCAGQHRTGANPFVSHAFLAALEDSGSLGGESGWLPRHLAAEGADGALRACAPLYLKGHSYGEYVFDWAWADALTRAGGRYYPKLLCAVPFTPVPGPRLLADGQEDADGLRAALAAAMARLAEDNGLSSAHVNFCTEDEWRLLGRAGYMGRIGHQFHWHNRGYRDFDDFLAALSSRKRKAVVKERRAAAASGLTFRCLEGAEVTGRHWDAVYRFYLSTSARKWGEPYLNRAFFDRIGRTMGERVVLFTAEDESGRTVATALNFRGGDGLYGRYWGAETDLPFLHFELCYHQAVDYAIERGLARVEAGAQGPHKLARGYLPVPTYSAHWIAHPELKQAVARFLDHERAEVAAEIAELTAQGPYRRG